MSLADVSKEKDGEEPADASQKSSEEFTDAKHESLFSLETNFLEEDSGGSSSSQRTSQGESGSSCPSLPLLCRTHGACPQESCHVPDGQELVLACLNWCGMVRTRM